MPQREVIPPEIIDPLGTMTSQQRAMRAWYLRNREAHMARSRLNFWKDRDRQLLLRRERYYITRYLRRAGNLEALFEHDIHVLERAARAFRKQAWKAVLKANHVQAARERMEDDGGSEDGGRRALREHSHHEGGAVSSHLAGDEGANGDRSSPAHGCFNPPPSPASFTGSAGSVFDGDSVYAACGGGHSYVASSGGSEGGWTSEGGGSDGDGGL